MGSLHPTIIKMARVLVFSFLLATALAASLNDKSSVSWRCPQPLVNCVFNDIQQGEPTEDWKGCAAQCAALPDCQYWTFVFAPPPSVGCYLKSSCLITWPDPNAYSGSKDCVTWDCDEGWEVPECQTTVAHKNLIGQKPLHLHKHVLFVIHIFY